MTPQKQKQSGGLIDPQVVATTILGIGQGSRQRRPCCRGTRDAAPVRPSILRRRPSPIVIESRQFLIRENLQHKVEDHDDTAGRWPRRPG